jgi:hypothetical protein
LNARFIVEAPLFDLRKKTFFSQLSLKVFDCLFYLIILDDNFHLARTSHFDEILGIWEKEKHLRKTIEVLFPGVTKVTHAGRLQIGRSITVH